MTTERGFEFDAAVAAVEASDARWRRSDEEPERSQFDRRALERFAYALAFTTQETPRWTETVVFPGLAGTSEIEVRVLTASALLIATTPWERGDSGPHPVVKVRPLRLLRTLEVDGFEWAADRRPVGCTITLLFDDGPGVRLGASPGVDRTVLADVLPSLMELLVD